MWPKVPSGEENSSFVTFALMPSDAQLGVTAQINKGFIFIIIIVVRAGCEGWGFGMDVGISGKFEHIQLYFNSLVR